MAGIKLSAGSLKFFTLIKERKITRNIFYTILIILWIIVRQWGKSLHEVAFMIYFFFVIDTPGYLFINETISSNLILVYVNQA